MRSVGPRERPVEHLALPFRRPLSLCRQAAIGATHRCLANAKQLQRPPLIAVRAPGQRHRAEAPRPQRCALRSTPSTSPRASNAHHRLCPGLLAHQQAHAHTKAPSIRHLLHLIDKLPKLEAHNIHTLAEPRATISVRARGSSILVRTSKSPRRAPHIAPPCGAGHMNSRIPACLGNQAHASHRQQ